jgi:hypothetical protein
MRQHHVVALAAERRLTPPEKIAALADTEDTAQTMDGEFRFRRIGSAGAGIGQLSTRRRRERAMSPAELRRLRRE